MPTSSTSSKPKRAQGLPSSAYTADPRWFRALIAAVTAAITVGFGGEAYALDMPLAWNARFSTFLGDTDCKYGAPDCNRCVYDVEGQFRSITQEGNHRSRLKMWELEPRANLEPSGREANDVLTLTPKDSAHFQSFVRAATDPLGFAPTLFASYGGVQGGLFAIGADSSASGQIKDGELQYIYTTQSAHAGGMQAVGHHLLVAHYGGSKLPIVDGTRWSALQLLDIATMPDQSTGVILPFPGVLDKNGVPGMASVAATKVAGGGYLILVAGDSQINRYHLFYTNSLDKPHLERVLMDTFQASWAPSVGGFESFENISMVTECGTGKTFVVGATAPAFSLGSTYGNAKSTWSLYELRSGTNMTLKHVTNSTRKMLAQECDPRAAGTAFAGKHGELTLYCHQKARDPNARVSGIVCAVGAAAALVGFVTPALAMCLDTFKPDSQILFKEYMSNAGTPEAPPVSQVPVSVTVSHDPTYGGRLGVLSVAGDVCEVTEGEEAKTCVWHVDAGSSLTLIPFRGLGETFTKWVGDCSQEPLAEGHANVCKRTVRAGMSFKLVGGSFI